jgi:redox-sensing transcriptional repressor
VPRTRQTQEGTDRRVPLQTVERLSVYRKVLVELHEEGVVDVFSHRLAALAGVTPAQLRRDLSIFGSFGTVARGYEVYPLLLTIGRLLGTDTLQTVALVGMGNLGRTLLMYRGFEERGFHIGVAFDLDREKTGRVFAGRRCYPMDSLETVLVEYGVRIAVLACGVAGLQALVDRLAAAGIRSVLNFVPKRVNPPAGVHVEDVDLAARLEKLSFLSRGD